VALFGTGNGGLYWAAPAFAYPGDIGSAQANTGEYLPMFSFCWFRFNNASFSGQCGPVGIGSPTLSGHIGLRIGGTGFVGTGWANDSAISFANGAGTIQLVSKQWYFIAQVDTTVNNRSSYVGTSISNTDTSGLASPQLFSFIVGKGNSNWTMRTDQMVAEAGFGLNTLGTGEIAALAAGANPLTVLGPKLLAYFPLRNELRDYSYNRHAGLTQVGNFAPIWGEHPPVNPPPLQRRFYIPSIGAIITTGTGTATGTSTAAATGRALVSSVGTAIGISTANATSAVLSKGIGSVSGTSTAAGVGAPVTIAAGAGSSVGTSTANGTASARSISTATSTGTSSVVGFSTSITNISSTGTITGTSTVAGVGKSLGIAIGTITGTSTVAGVGKSLGIAIGTITGTSTVAGVGKSLGTATGTSAGSSIVIGSGYSVTGASSVGSAPGVSTANAVSKSLNSSIGSATGLASVNGVGAFRFIATGTAVGTSTAIATGYTITGANAVGTASGLSTSNAIGKSTALSVGSVIGLSTSIAYTSSSITNTGAGIAVGQSTANAYSTSITVKTSVGTAVGSSTAQAKANANFKSIANALGTSTASATGYKITGAGATGSAAGTSAANAIGIVTTNSKGTAPGASTAHAVGQIGNVGKATGTSSAIALSQFLAIRSSIAVAHGTSSAHGIPPAVPARKFHKQLYDFLEPITSGLSPPLQLVFARQNAPKGNKPLAVIDVVSIHLMQHEYYSLPNVDGIQRLSSMRMANVNLQIFGHGAGDTARWIAQSMMTETSIQRMQRLDVSVGRRNLLTEIPSLLNGSQYEERGIYQFVFYFTEEMDDDVGLIEAVEYHGTLEGSVTDIHMDCSVDARPYLHPPA
jgi:hypothetical protein